MNLVFGTLETILIKIRNIVIQYSILIYQVDLNDAEKRWIVTITAKTLSICDPYFPKNLKYLALLTVIDHTVIFHTECMAFYVYTQYFL